MQSFVILWRSFPVYIVPAGASNTRTSRRNTSGGGTFGGRTSRGLASLGAGVHKSEGLLSAAEQGKFL